MDISALDPLAMLRILCGIWFVPHCIGKAMNIGPASATFDKAGFRPAQTFVVVTIVAEVLAGIGLVTGILATAAAVLAAAVLAGASYAVLKINGANWRWQKQGPEFMVFWSLACLLSVAG